MRGVIVVIDERRSQVCVDEDGQTKEEGAIESLGRSDPLKLWQVLLREG
jgi:hypothetical protein